MRLEAQQKGGYYPIHQDAIRHVAQRIRPPAGRFCILDPCAGRGEAIRTWAEVLGVPPEYVYAVELEDDRADACRQTLGEEAHVLGPASAFGVQITSGAFPFVWLNPPFDDAIGGGHRVETQFVVRATRWVMPGGVLALCCPQAVAENYGLQMALLSWFREISVIPLPAEHRPFNEVVLLCRKQRYWCDPKETWFEAECEDAPDVYWLPTSVPPLEFVKTALTEPEIRQALVQSPLRKLLREPPAVEVARPPLELGVGHLALLLASGQLDGLVCPENEPPHVVRGVCRKVEYLADVEVDEEKDTTKEIYRERIEMIVRTVDVAGRITTLGNLKEKANG
jgi:hypothetical protein